MALPKKMLVEFCLPVYNEKRILKTNVIKLLDFLNRQNFAFSWLIVIVNNGSTDNTVKIGRELTGERIKIINFSQKGKGGAIKRYSLMSAADWLIYMDVDLAVSLENINDLIKILTDNNYDIIMGSRLLTGSKVERSFIRSLSSKIYNSFSRLILKHKFFDLQCGFKMIRGEVLKKITPLIKDSNWFFDTELIYLAYRRNYRIKEIPVNWSENRYQLRKSKVKLIKDGLKFLKNLIELKTRL
ncbi:glycosyltransferase [Candidatus Falkowbacteria bacterium]|nr:glycosyltransferase [Candidatus Falkowbacteria bacterium]